MQLWDKKKSIFFSINFGNLWSVPVTGPSHRQAKIVFACEENFLLEMRCAVLAEVLTNFLSWFLIFLARLFPWFNLYIVVRNTQVFLSPETEKCFLQVTAVFFIKTHATNSE